MKPYLAVFVPLLAAASMGLATTASAHDWDDDWSPPRHHHQHRPADRVVVYHVYEEPEVVYYEPRMAPPSRVIYRDRVVYRDRPVYYESAPRYYERSAPVYYGDRSNRIAGQAVGAIAGGILGNQIGRGSGRVAATAVGAAVGAIVGGNLSD